MTRWNVYLFILVCYTFIGTIMRRRTNVARFEKWINFLCEMRTSARCCYLLSGILNCIYLHTLIIWRVFSVAPICNSTSKQKIESKIESYFKWKKNGKLVKKEKNYEKKCLLKFYSIWIFTRVELNFWLIFKWKTMLSKLVVFPQCLF